MDGCVRSEATQHGEGEGKHGVETRWPFLFFVLFVVVLFCPTLLPLCAPGLELSREVLCKDYIYWYTAGIGFPPRRSVQKRGLSFRVH